jgi:hypothetical protein
MPLMIEIDLFSSMLQQVIIYIYIIKKMDTFYSNFLIILNYIII